MDNSGQEVRGFMEAESDDEAQARLRGQGIFVTNLSAFAFAVTPEWSAISLSSPSSIPSGRLLAQGLPCTNEQRGMTNDGLLNLLGEGVVLLFFGVLITALAVLAALRCFSRRKWPIATARITESKFVPGRGLFGWRDPERNRLTVYYSYTVEDKAFDASVPGTAQQNDEPSTGNAAELRKLQANRVVVLKELLDLACRRYVTPRRWCRSTGNCLLTA